jgi:serine/threonine protein kinase
MTADLPPGGLLPGTRFGRYDIVRLIGAGGMGHVYEAQQWYLNKRVALKVLSPHHERDAAERRERFVREARAAARIRHPNVVEIFDVGLHEDAPFLAMEFLDGSDLRAHFKVGPMSPEALLDILLPAIAGVRAAHDAGVIHRDLKPENIFVSQESNGELKPMVVDFGVSKVIETAGALPMTATSVIIGTPLYMSPEQARSGRDVDARTDQYALGVILYEGLSGRNPFNGQTLYEVMLQKIEGGVPPLAKLCPTLSGRLCSVVEQAMAIDRQARFAAIAELGLALLPFASERTRMVFGSWFESRAHVATAVQQKAAATATAPSPIAPSSAPLAGDDRAPLEHSTLRASAHEIAVTRTPGRRRLWLQGMSAFVLVAGVLALSLSRRHMPDQVSAPVVPGSAAVKQSTSSPSAAERRHELFSFQLAVTPRDARVELDGKPLTDSDDPLVVPRDGTLHTLYISATGYESQTVTFVDAPPARDIVLRILDKTADPAPSVPPAAIRSIESAQPQGPRASEPEQPTPRNASRGNGSRPHAGPTRVTSNGAPILY